MINKCLFILNAYLPPLAWAGLIFYLSSQPPLPGPDLISLDFFIKKMGHIVFYAILYLLIVRAVQLQLPTMSRFHPVYLYLPLFLCLLYALSDEFHQSFVANRTPTVRDIGFDMLGATIVFLRNYHYI